MAHLHVFGNIKAEGTRLTDLAASAGLGLPAMAELVDEMEGRRSGGAPPRPRDGGPSRDPDPGGWDAIRTGRAIIARIEADYARRLGAERYEQMCWALQDLLEELAGAPMRRAEDPA